MKTGTLITLGLVLILGISFAFWAIGLSNSEIKLRNRGSAQQESCAAYFDKVWKILQQQAQVADQYKDAFKEVYPLLMEGRYSDDGQGQQTFMKWVTEHNPEFKIELYEKLMASIEGQREGFFIEQQKLIDIDRQHKNMRMTFPKKLVIGKREDLAIVIIKSLKTEDAYKTGQENEVDLFKKN